MKSLIFTFELTKQFEGEIPKPAIICALTSTVFLVFTWLGVATLVVGYMRIGKVIGLVSSISFVISHFIIFFSLLIESLEGRKK